MTFFTDGVWKKKTTEPQPPKSSEKSINFTDACENISEKFNRSYGKNTQKFANTNLDVSNYLGCKNAYHEVDFNSREFCGLDIADDRIFLQNCSGSVTRPDLDIPKLPDDLLSCGRNDDDFIFPETPASNETAIGFSAEFFSKNKKNYRNDKMQKSYLRTKGKSTKAVGRNPQISTAFSTSTESFDLIDVVHATNVYFQNLPPNMSMRTDNSGDSPKTIVTVRVPKNLESEEFYGVIYGYLVTIKEGGKTWFVCSFNEQKYSLC